MKICVQPGTHGNLVMTDPLLIAQCLKQVANSMLTQATQVMQMKKGGWVDTGDLDSE